MTIAEGIDSLPQDNRIKYEVAKIKYKSAWKDEGYIKFAFEDNSYLALRIEAVKKRLY